ncbi:MAG: hypothetical protein ACYDBV_04925 [Nitrospiria bacterium]
MPSGESPKSQNNIRGIKSPGRPKLTEEEKARRKALRKEMREVAQVSRLAGAVKTGNLPQPDNSKAIKNGLDTLYNYFCSEEWEADFMLLRKKNPAGALSFAFDSLLSCKVILQTRPKPEPVPIGESQTETENDPARIADILKILHEVGTIDLSNVVSIPAPEAVPENTNEEPPVPAEPPVTEPVLAEETLERIETRPVKPPDDERWNSDLSRRGSDSPPPGPVRSSGEGEIRDKQF